MTDFLLSLPGYNLRRASSLMLAELSEALKELDLRPTDASMLLTIKARPRITPSDIGKQLGIQRANMVPMVARLEERAALRRIALDGRSYGLELTPEGQELAQQAAAVLEQKEHEFMLRVPEEHREHLLPALQALWR